MKLNSPKVDFLTIKKYVSTDEQFAKAFKLVLLYVCAYVVKPSNPGIARGKLSCIAAASVL
jgi:hypothetical protein